MLIDSPGFSRDVLMQLVGGLPDTRLVSNGPDVVVVDDRHFAHAMPLMRSGIPTIVLGADDDPGYAARAQRHGALRWVLKDSVSATLPELLRRVASPLQRA
jgi:DNA-binding NarL/FixJ family response regulator